MTQGEINKLLKGAENKYGPSINKNIGGNMYGKLFWVIAAKNPPKKEVEENDAMSEIVMQPKVILARSEQDAVVQTLLSNPPELKDIPKNQLDVIVRPF